MKKHLDKILFLSLLACPPCLPLGGCSLLDEEQMQRDQPTERDTQTTTQAMHGDRR